MGLTGMGIVAVTVLVVDTYGNGCENGAEAHRVDWIVGIAVGIGGESSR